MIYPYVTFGIEVGGSANKALLDRICIMQKPVIHWTAHYLEHTLPKFKRLHFQKIEELVKYILKDRCIFTSNMNHQIQLANYSPKMSRCIVTKHDIGPICV